MSNKYLKVIFEYSNINYKKFNKDNISKYLSEEIFCSFYSDLIFHLSSTGFYFIILHNCLNKHTDSDPVSNNIELLDFFIQSTKDLNNHINSEHLSYFIDYLSKIYEINIELFKEDQHINSELEKFSKIEEDFFNKHIFIEKEVALFLCDNYYDESMRNIFPEFETIKKLDKF